MKKKEFELSMLKILFLTRVFNMTLILMARGTEKECLEDFESTRKNLLESELISNPEHKQVKEWLDTNSDFLTADLPSLVTIYDDIMSKQ